MMDRYRVFYEYMKSLCGQGLMVAGWHLNGEFESFETFFDRACHWMNNPRELWQAFGDVPMNPETECIDVDWMWFPKGTHREEIWHWFERTFDVRVYDLMYQSE